MEQLKQVIDELHDRRDYLKDNAKNNVDFRVMKLDTVIESMRGYVMLRSKELVSDESIREIINKVREQYLNNK